MTVAERWAYVFAVICYAPLQLSPPVVGQTPAAGHEPAGRVSPIISQTLPKLNGDDLRLQMVQVRYAPGESSQSHSHPCPVVGYIVKGSVMMQVQEHGAKEPGPVMVYRAGDSFYEAPNGRHLVSANASRTEPAVFLATFVCDHSTALSIPAPSNMGTHP